MSRNWRKRVKSMRKIIDKKKKLRPSILDRLIDNEPHTSAETEQSQHQHLMQLRNSVRRDIENLLNTRYRLISPDDEYRQLENSLLNYGLPDLATVNIVDQERKNVFINDLKNIIKRFEPRFKSINIHYLDNPNKGDHSLHFRIDGVLYADPAPEIVIFDSTLEPVSRTVSVQEV